MATTATPKANATSFVTASAAAYWTLNASVIGNLKEILLANTSTVASVTVTLYNVPSAGSASSGNILCPPVSIAASNFVRIPFNTFLAASGTLQAKADTASIATITVSGLEYA